MAQSPAVANIFLHSCKKKFISSQQQQQQQNRVVIMDLNEYIDCCLTISNDREKFKCLHKDPTQIREGKFQRLLRKLRSEGKLDETTYRNIYPKGSQPARFYGLPKLHKKREAGSPPRFKPIFSSIGAYNYSV